MTVVAAPTQCVILVGGLGTRLGDLTKEMPKPLLEVAGESFLETLLWHVQRYGFTSVLLLAGFQAEKVRRFAAETRFSKYLDIQVIDEPQPMGTGGALRFAADHLDDRFLLMNGDSVFDFNWLDLVPLLQSGDDAQVAMSLRRLPDASRYGVVNLEGSAVRDFVERGTIDGGLVNGGIYLCNRKILDRVSGACSLERDILPQLAKENRVVGREYDGFFLDIGVPDDFARGNHLVPASKRRGAIFFDRDGVLNEDHGYVFRFDDFDWIAGAVEAVKLANDRHQFAFMVTNQAGVARGFYTEDHIAVLHDQVQQHLRARGAHFDDIRYCPHHPEGVIDAYRKSCDWRKPMPGMLRDLMAHWPVDPSLSVLIGDKAGDVEAAVKAGIAGLLFDGSISPDRQLEAHFQP